MSKLVLFDCDGTLVDSERLCNVALLDVLKPYGVEINPDEMVEKYRGAKLALILEAIVREHDLNLPEDFVVTYRDHLSDLYDTGLEPVAGVKELLEKIELPMGVVSNGPKDKVEQALKVSGIDHYFKGNIFSAYDIQIWKPDPGIYINAAEKMGYKPEDCVVIEDSLSGVESAVTAGMTTLYYNPHGGPNMFADEGVVEFKSMAELSSKFDKFR